MEKKEIEKQLIEAKKQILQGNDANTMEGIVEITKAHAMYLGLCEIADAIRGIDK